MNNPHRQQGVALLCVLLITALVVLVVSNILARQRLNLHSSINLQQQQQLWQLALSGEAWAQQQLLEDAHSEGGLLVTHLGQHWAQHAPTLKIDDAQVHIKVEDLSARLNLNSLFRQNDHTLRARYQRLLAQQKLPNHDPSLLFALQNDDGQPQLLSDLSELHQLPQVNNALLKRLAPLVDAFDTSSININTAPAEVLACIEGIDAATAHTLASTRPAKGYPSLQAFLSNPMLQGRNISPVGLGINSRQFRATITVEQGMRRLQLVSDLRLLNSENVRVTQRTLLPAGKIKATHASQSL